MNFVVSASQSFYFLREQAKREAKKQAKREARLAARKAKRKDSAGETREESVMHDIHKPITLEDLTNPNQK